MPIGSHGGTRAHYPQRHKSGVDGVIHLLDQDIVPEKNDNQQAIYQVQVIAVCPLVEDNFSSPLTVTQERWGDVLGDPGCPVGTPGTGATISDVLGILNKFSNALCAIKKTRADLEPAALDMKINITDVLMALGGFGNGIYPFAAGSACAAGG